MERVRFAMHTGYVRTGSLSTPVFRDPKQVWNLKCRFENLLKNLLKQSKFHNIRIVFLKKRHILAA